MVSISMTWSNDSRRCDRYWPTAVSTTISLPSCSRIHRSPPPRCRAIYDKGFADGHSKGAEQGRRSAVIAAARPMGILDTSDVGPGVNGYGWFEIAQHCAANKHRVSRDKDRDFVESVYEQIALAADSSRHRRQSGCAIFSINVLAGGLTDAADYRSALRDGDQRLHVDIPVIGKKPVLDQWQKTKNVSREMLEAWSRNCPTPATPES